MGERDNDGDDRQEYGEPDGAGETITLTGLEQHAHFRTKAPPPDHCVAAPTGIDPALARTIQSEIIPRLLMAHRTRAAQRPTEPAEPPVADDDIATLVALSLREPLPRMREFIDGLQARGATIETIVGDVLPAAARHVGWMWDTDACTFVDVTCSLTRLQQLLRHYAPSLSLDVSRAGEGRRMLLSAMPGEQHTFGLAVAEEFFRQAAWEVAPHMPVDLSDLLKSLREDWFDIVGLSASGDGVLASMPALIQKIRASSLNQSVRVIVGGAAVLRNLEIADTAGADAVARDARDGIEKMEWMMQALRQPC